MSEHARDQRSAHGEPSHRPGLFERLRGLLGLGGASIRDDIQEALEETAATTDFSAQERTMLKNVLGLHDLRVDDVMVPRADIIAVAAEATLGELLTLFRRASHSRLPVHGDTLDDPRGMVHIRDFVDRLALKAEAAATATAANEVGAADAVRPPVTFHGLDLSVSVEAAGLVRSVLYAPPSMPALDLLVKMQATRTHMALVIDEYGGTDGLVTIEDIVEMVVGDIEDEHDEDDDATIEEAADGSFVASARVNLEDVATALAIDRESLTEGEDVETLGGLIVTLAGRVPVRGELIAGPNGLEFEILEADPRRIKRLRVRRHADTPGATLPGADSPISEDAAAETGEAADTPPPTHP